MNDTAETTLPDLAPARAALAASRFDEALGTAQARLNAAPGDVDALYLAAVTCRYAERPDDAAAYLDRLLYAAPEYGRGWQERGHSARSRADISAALNAYLRAVEANPTLIASWRARAALLDDRDRGSEAAACRRQAAHWQEMPKPLLAAANLMHEGKLLKAEALCRKFMQQNPKNIEGMRILADIGKRLGVLEDAEFLLESALAFAPDHIAARIDYMQVLRQRQKFAAARQQAETLYHREPGNPLFQSHYAIESLQTGDYETALRLFDSILERLPHDPATLTSRGHALKTTGRQQDAVASYRSAIAARADHGDAYYALANLKTYRFTDTEIEAMAAQAARSDLAPKDRVHICFSLGKAYEDRGDPERSFEWYQQGNDLKRRQSNYDADRMTEDLRAQERLCTSALFTAQAGRGHDAPDPIFILGLPRAGSTLLEQILASHSQVDGTLELPNILSLAQKLRGRGGGADARRYPEILHDLSAGELAEMGRDYIENTRIHRQQAPFFIDKMPNNFRHVGLIHLILPNAKIIDARRAPMDCCFSAWKQLFAEGQEFSYDLQDLGRYYADYVRLMDHWDRALPGRVLRVQHEDVLMDTEGQVRRMLDHVGLAFERRCLDFHKTDRAVRTASSEQVRRPVNRDGVAAWRPFEPWLEPLKNALGALAPHTSEGQRG